MKLLRWNHEKNLQLRQERNISFEEIELALTQDKLLDVIDHPNQDRYPNQKIFIINLNQYVCLVPFVENDQEIFLKIIIPSRKMTKQYLGSKSQ